MSEWWQAPAILKDVSDSKRTYTIVREDLIEGGSKIRFLPYLVQGASEVVYGGPFCGGAQVALSVWGMKKGVAITLFAAKRDELHARQKTAMANGAKLVQVPYGYMTNVQAKARAYAAASGGLFLPLGFDLPIALEPFVAHMRAIGDRVPGIDEIWCATGSGMLAKCLGRAFPDVPVNAVVVGLRSKNSEQSFTPNVRLIDSAHKFEQQTKSSAPFPSCPNYDRKAWELCVRGAKGRRILFWNVLG